MIKVTLPVTGIITSIGKEKGKVTTAQKIRKKELTAVNQGEQCHLGGRNGKRIDGMAAVTTNEMTEEGIVAMTNAMIREGGEKSDEMNGLTRRRKKGAGKEKAEMKEADPTKGGIKNTKIGRTMIKSRNKHKGQHKPRLH